MSLWDKDPKCKKCGIVTRLQSRGATSPLDDDIATLQHMYHRGHPVRENKNIPEEAMVQLWCHKCNKEDSYNPVSILIHDGYFAVHNSEDNIYELQDSDVNTIGLVDSQGLYVTHEHIAEISRKFKRWQALMAIHSKCFINLKKNGGK